MNVKKRGTFEFTALSISDPTNLFDLTALFEELAESVLINRIRQTTTEYCGTSLWLFRELRG
jgi:hypothetical protein